MAGEARILTLFLSNGKSLLAWEREAVLSREILLYLNFLREDVFDRIQIFSYDAGDRQFLKELAKTDPLYERMDILAPKSGALFGTRAARWGVQGVFEHRKAIARSLALKTNQISGSWAALAATRLTRKPLVLRMGYLLSRRFAKNGERRRERIAKAVEAVAFRLARYILVTSQEVADTLAANPVTAGKTILTPTYVDVGIFAAKQSYAFDEPLIWVGRFTPQKNPENLLRGCALAKRDIVMVGSGEMEAEVRALAATLPINVTFAGLIPNDQLAAKLREHSVFILPSLHEGLPKVLIEAMACGLVCIGTRISGIVDLIEDGANGYLVDSFEAEAIAAAIRRAYDERNASLGRRARATVEDVFSLERYAARERDLYRSLDQA
jgi:glycosyltransferase involved in cell wall biosynthesis